jgi:type IV secretory pathway VirB9-like protein
LIDEVVAGTGRAPGMGGGAGAAPRAAIRDSFTPVGDRQTAWDPVCARQPDIDRPVAVWPYRWNETRCVHLRELLWTTIVLPPWDKVVDWNLGDEAAFEIVLPPKRPNVILVRPTGGMVGTDTNLTVIGDGTAPAGGFRGRRNVYSLLLRSFSTADPVLPNSVLYVNAPGQGLGWGGEDMPPPSPGVEMGIKNPGDAPATPGGGGSVKLSSDGVVAEARGGAVPEYIRAIPFDMAKMRFNDYQIFAGSETDASIAPVRVFHDGTFTYLDFGEDGRSDRMLQPVLFQVVDGIDSRVNTRISGPAGNILVAEAVGDFTLRNGERVVCIRYRREIPPPPDVVVGGGGAPAKESSPDRETVQRAKAAPGGRATESPPSNRGIMD